MPRSITSREPSVETLLIVGDTQIPFQDDRAVAVMMKLAENLPITHVYAIGDIIDFYAISSHLPNPARRVQLQEELNLGHKFLASLNEVTPNAQHFFVEGNHEDRLRRYIWAHAPELAGTDMVQLPSCLGLDRLGYTHIPYPRGIHHRTLYLVHGDLVSKHSAYTAKQMLEHYGSSGVSGHTHRLGSHYRTNLGGIHGWWENGCLCRTDNVEYDNWPNWQQGFTIVTFIGDQFFVTPVPIISGRLIYGGKLYVA